LRLFSFGGYGLALAALALVVFGAYDSYPAYHYIGLVRLVKRLRTLAFAGTCHKRKKPQAAIQNNQTRKVANAKGLNHNTNLT